MVGVVQFWAFSGNTYVIRVRPLRVRISKVLPRFEPRHFHGLKKRKKVYHGIGAQSGGATGFLRLSVAGHRIKFSKNGSGYSLLVARCWFKTTGKTGEKKHSPSLYGANVHDPCEKS